MSRGLISDTQCGLVVPAAQYDWHAAVAAGIGIQLGAAWLPSSAELLGGARIPIELWAVVFGGHCSHGQPLKPWRSSHGGTTRVEA
jgi:hypothetical protein